MDALIPIAVACCRGEIQQNMTPNISKESGNLVQAGFIFLERALSTRRLISKERLTKFLISSKYHGLDFLSTSFLPGVLYYAHNTAGVA